MSGVAEEILGPGDGGPVRAEVAEVTAAAKVAAEAAKAAAEAAEAAADAASKAATEAPGTQGAADAAAAARTAEAKARGAAVTAREAAATTRTAAAATRAAAAPKPVTLGSAWPFLKKGLRDFWSNIKRTWIIILVFIVYLFAAASALYGFLRVSAKIPSWLHALYSTWLSMSTAGELTSKSSKWVWALGALNTLVGLLFFGFIVWLVTTSLYQAPDR